MQSSQCLLPAQELLTLPPQHLQGDTQLEPPPGVPVPPVVVPEGLQGWQCLGAGGQQGWPGVFKEEEK